MVALLCAGAITLSAVLLFLLEPLVGRLVLPVFGGVPAVWATVLCFFQAVLLLGYLYGHLSVSRLGLRRSASLHVLVAAIACAAAIVAPVGYQGLLLTGVPTALNVLWILAFTVGLPTFLITATTPLVSTWYVASRARSLARPDPYWLYALSNAGSLVALLAYPFLVEPAVGLARQRSLWIAALGVLCILLGAAALSLLWRTRGIGDGADRVAAGVHDAPPSITRGRRLRWLLLAAIPSGLLAAVTNFIATDLISAPLLWVGPLSIYLASLIVVFSRGGRRTIRPAVALCPVAVTLLWVPLGSAGVWPVVPLLLLELLCLGLVCVALHGLLVEDRPEPRALTEFYLVLALGGVLGSGLVALVAPVAFKGIWEYPLLLVGALAAISITVGSAGATVDRVQTARQAVVGWQTLSVLRGLTAGLRLRLIPYAIVAGALVAILAAGRSTALETATRWLLVGGLILVFGGRPRVLAVTTAVVLAIGVFVLPPAAVFQDRNFFGVLQVVRPATQPITELKNGTTVHGAQWLDTARRAEPMNEFSTAGPAGDIFATVREESAQARSIGVVGLGAGELATYARPGDSLTFYEINPLDIQVASDPAYFTYLRDAAVGPRLIVGDGRLLLDQDAPGTFDVLVLDAFSSDAVPVHLLTTEAIADDLRTLRPDGVLVFHVSNRYYDLQAAVAAGIQALGVTALAKDYVPTAPEAAKGAAASRWLAGSRDPALLARLTAEGWHRVAVGVAPLTDDNPDVTRFLQLPW